MSDIYLGRKVGTVGQRATHAANFRDVQGPWEHFPVLSLINATLIFELCNNVIREA